MSEKQIRQARRICADLPETPEKLSHGEPTFSARKKVRPSAEFGVTLDDFIGRGL